MKKILYFCFSATLLFAAGCSENDENSQDIFSEKSARELIMSNPDRYIGNPSYVENLFADANFTET
jgi:hypothetical protein